MGTLALGQSLSSSQITSSHSTLPLSQTQIWQGTGFHTSRSWYLRPFCTQVTGGTGARRGDGGCQRRASPLPRAYEVNHLPKLAISTSYYQLVATTSFIQAFNTGQFNYGKLLFPLPTPHKINMTFLKLKSDFMFLKLKSDYVKYLLIGFHFTI